MVGIRDLALSEKMQTNPTLTLEAAKTMVRQKAAVKDHLRELQMQAGGEAALGRLHQSGPKPPSKHWPSKRGNHRGGANKPKPEVQCTRCGRDKHKKGHFRAHCFSKTHPPCREYLQRQIRTS